MRPRVGHIGFLNCLPIYHGLVKGSGILDLDLVRGAPTELNARLLSGELDVSPISSIEYARHPEQLLLLPGPTVSCRGPVRSIVLASRLPLAELDGRPVALTDVSATSHVLLKSLLEAHVGVRPRYVPCGTDLDAALAKADAALLIGDAALEQVAAPPEGVELHDLGALWRERTGRGMVFAVWAVRREFARRSPALVSHVWRLFQGSLAWCESHLGEIARAAARWERFPAEFLEDYFRSLSFGFEEDLQGDLLAFYAAARAVGDLDREPSGLELFAPEGAARRAVAAR